MILMIITVVIIAINIEGWLTVLSHVISTIKLSNRSYYNFSEEETKAKEG